MASNVADNEKLTLFFLEKNVNSWSIGCQCSPGPAKMWSWWNYYGFTKNVIITVDNT